MPNYRGLDVLKNECDILELQNTDDRISISLIDDAEYMKQADREAVREMYQSFINKRNDKIQTYSRVISRFVQGHDPSSQDISYEPLEYLYQEFLCSNLNEILRKIELFFENYSDALMQDNVAHFMYSAKKIAIHSLHHHTLGYIVQEYLQRQKIKELESLWVTKEVSKKAIEEKYSYYSDRIVSCLEIGNKLRELKLQ